MGKLNEIQEQTTQSWGDNSFTTTIKENTVEFDSAKDSFTFNDPVEVPELRINGTEIVAFDAEDRAKLDNLQTPMQIKGRVDGVGDLPTEDVKVGEVYLVGLSGDGNFEEYVCTEVSGSPATPVWECLGHVKTQSDWDQSNNSSDNYIKNKPAIKAGQGENSIIEGSGTTASGLNSHAEGYHTEASGQHSHAEGYETTASGFNSHTEGTLVTASGTSSHAEGCDTTASGSYSHTEGHKTTAKNRSQHAFGEFNELDPSTASSWDRGTYIEIAGNGVDENTRSNARTLDWDGNETLAGNLTIGGTITANGVNLNEEINLKEPLLPAAPEQPESKFLNANKQWVEIAGGGQTTVYKSIAIENPTASENMCIFYTPVAMTITEIRGVITGATSVSFKVVSGTSRNAVTTEHNSSAVVCSSVTTGDVATITTAAVAAGSWVAVKTSAIAGAPSELVITLSLNY